MSEPNDDIGIRGQLQLFDELNARAILDQLLSDTKLYRQGADYKALLEFVIRISNVAPFNALLLNLQRPGITYVASAFEWKTKFGRSPKTNARPLVILWPFCPVLFVYDVQDTEGKELPPGARAFFTRGKLKLDDIHEFNKRLGRSHIYITFEDWGEGNAGRVIRTAVDLLKPENNRYLIEINKNHNASTQFVTIIHELAHMFLGHLGPDKKLRIPDRCHVDSDQREVEAESVAYVVARRNGLEPPSAEYLADYFGGISESEFVDLYQITRSAGRIEDILGLSTNTDFGPDLKKTRQ